MITPKPIDVILIGAGSRGRDVYGRYIAQHPEQFRLVAVADPNLARRVGTAQQHQIPPQHQFSSWEELLKLPPLGQAAIVATQDQYHFEPTLAALKAGYDVLLEKPMSDSQDNCVNLVKAADETGQLLQIAHVLRYTPLMQKIKQVLESEELGEIITVAHRENVSYWHMAHSYVRGNWRNSAQSSPMILAKCSHDLDLLYWLLERKCVRLSSVGSLRHFSPEHAPPGVPNRCTDGCPVAESCLFNADKIYLDLQPFIGELEHSQQRLHRLAGKAAASRLGQGLLKTLKRIHPALHPAHYYHGWPRSVVSDDPGEAAVLKALETGPYGRCVYHCDNDVVDHQVVAMEFEDGISVTLTMHGHSHREGRTIRIDGTLATLYARMTLFESEIEIHNKQTQHIHLTRIPHPIHNGHGGGDAHLMDAFYQALTQHAQPPLTTATASLESHLLAFAAEEARLKGSVIQMDRYRAQAWTRVQPPSDPPHTNREAVTHPIDIVPPPEISPASTPDQPDINPHETHQPV